MRAAVSLFIAALVCVALAWWISLLPGTVNATVAGTTIETSTPVAITLLAALFLVFYVVIRLLAWLVSLPRRARIWRSRPGPHPRGAGRQPGADRAGGE